MDALTRLAVVALRCSFLALAGCTTVLGVEALRPADCVDCEPAAESGLEAPPGAHAPARWAGGPDAATPETGAQVRDGSPEDPCEEGVAIALALIGGQGGVRADPADLHVMPGGSAKACLRPGTFVRLRLLDVTARWTGVACDGGSVSERCEFTVAAAASIVATAM